jgi:hypothetical protein
VIPQYRRKEFDQLVPALNFEVVEQELSEIEEKHYVLWELCWSRLILIEKNKKRYELCRRGVGRLRYNGWSQLQKTPCNSLII